MSIVIEHLNYIYSENTAYQRQALKDINLEIGPQEHWAIAGESGAGKSMTMYALTSLLPEKNTHISGKILYLEKDGSYTDILTMPFKKRTEYCARKVSLIFQDSINALNPFERIQKQWHETVAIHHPQMKKEEMDTHIKERLKLFGIADDEALRKYPHQLSGGMKQRIAIAMALEADNQILIADEPTTALDVTVQAQILGLIRRLQKETGTSVIFISHDMGVISQMADRVAVMYAGQLVEYAEGEKIFTEPKHPYTQGLQAAIPRLDEEKDTLLSIPGNVPMLYELPKGCIFSPRCAHATERCRNERPALVENSGHLVRCFLYEDNKKQTKSQSKGGAQA